MFRGCTSLKNAPALKATTLVAKCYKYMFHECSKLENVTIMATSGFDTSGCLFNWLGINDGTFGDYRAGKDASARTLKLNSQTEYNSIKNKIDNTSYVSLPDIWQAGASGTKILNKDDNDITGQ